MKQRGGFIGEGSNSAGTVLDTFEQEALPHLAAARAFALRLTGDRDAAADLVQNTFCRALRYWSTYRAGSNCRGWLFRICHNEFVRERTRCGRRPDHPSFRPDGLKTATRSAFSSAPFPDPETHTLNRLLREHLGTALQTLPDCYQRPLRLLLMEDLRYRDIADRLGIPMGTVKSRIHRGRDLLRDALLSVEATGVPRRDAQGARAGSRVDGPRGP